MSKHRSLVNVVRPNRGKVEWCGIGEVEDERDEDVEAGSRKMKKVNDPIKPSEDEVKEHAKTHLPYRSWCRHCVRGKGKEMSHRKGKE